MEHKTVKSKQDSKKWRNKMKRSLPVYIIFILILTITIVVIFRISTKRSQADIDVLSRQIGIYQLENQKLKAIIEQIRGIANTAVILEKAEDEDQQVDLF